MMMNLSELEMLNLWKLHHGYSTPRRDCSLERDDDAEIDSLLLDEMRAWYANVLLTTSPDLLPVEDVSEDCTVTKMAEGMVEMKLPSRCVRVIAVRLSAWKRDATAIHAAGSEADFRQSVEWLRGTVQHPVAIAGEGNVLRLYTVPAGAEAEAEKVLCVVRPADGSYQFAQSLLGSL